MLSKGYKRFYIVSLAVLSVFSAYPLVNGAYMAFLSIANGAIEPEQYARYVIPYAAMCFSIILFAAFQPLLFKTGRFSFPGGLMGAYCIFIALEQFFERIRIHTRGMSLVDTASLSVETAPDIASVTVDAWQASSCIASMTRVQAVAYASQDRYLYVMANNTYKIHYYLIALILITMVCGLVYGIGRMVRSGDRTKEKPLILQGLATAALVALCVFANTTAFFRQTEAIQTPLASILTCLFFVVLGASVGIYIGSFLPDRKRPGIGLAVFLSVAATVLMYIGEAAMMDGGLYRFGKGWFFDGLPGITLAPVDLLVVLLAGAATWLILRTARKKESWPGKRTAAVTLIVCVILAVSGTGFSMSVSNARDDIFGCYEFDECLYMNPLSSFIPLKGSMPYVYGVGEDSLVIANTETGDMEQLLAQHEKTPVTEDELSSKADFIPASFPFPNLSRYKERWLRAVFTGEAGQQYGLYQMDGEIWLVRLNGGRLWSIYKLQKTNKADLAGLEQALEARGSAPEGLRQMTLRDVYDLAGKGDSLTLQDLEAFEGTLVGSGFTILRYNIDGGCVLTVHCGTPDSPLNYARLSKRGYDGIDEPMTIDIRGGAQAVAAYLNPLHSSMKLKIEDTREATGGRELIYEYGGYRYYLNTRRADKVYITFENGERLPLKQALKARRLIVEDAVANGLYSVIMEPVDNPLGGEFSVLHHRHVFTFDNQEFYPSASFMYVVFDDAFATYFDLLELADILELQGRSEPADRLRRINNTAKLPVVAGKAYIQDTLLSEAGITVTVGYALSSRTPVSFFSTGD